jgi:peptide/nickel transport system substrate-binding protein
VLPLLRGTRPSLLCMLPAMAFEMDESRPIAFSGDDKLVELRGEFMRETDPAKKRKLAEAIQTRAFEVGTHVPLGEYRVPMAARKNISGFFVANGNLYWNIKKN